MSGVCPSNINIQCVPSLRNDQGLRSALRTRALTSSSLRVVFHRSDGLSRLAKFLCCYRCSCVNFLASFSSRMEILEDSALEMQARIILCVRNAYSVARFLTLNLRSIALRGYQAGLMDCSKPQASSGWQITANDKSGS